MQIKISITEAGYQALVDYMERDPEKYRTLSACVADLTSVGLEAVTGHRIALMGEGWGGQRAGAGRKPADNNKAPSR